MWDFTWIGDPSAWIGLGTLVILEIVLGIDNLVFISILSSKLPEGQKQRAFQLGLGLALVMRLLLLSVIAWIVTLTRPLFTVLEQSFSARDVILLVGGLFLLFKAIVELHERLEGSAHRQQAGGPQAVFWQVVAQILVLDAIFSLDSIITSVGMVKELPVMMLAVIMAMLVMLLAARPLTSFVEKHPTVIVLCLGFLLMIGLSLLLEGFGVHVPKGYLYAAVFFSLLVESFNQLALRNRRLRISPRNLRESTARAVLGLLGGKGSAAEAAALAGCGTELFAPEERRMVARIIRLGGRSVRYVMTPVQRMVWLPPVVERAEVEAVAAASPHVWIPVRHGATDDVPGIVHMGELLRALGREERLDVAPLLRPAPTVLEHSSLPEALDIFREQNLPFALVRDEYGAVVGCVSASDILHAMAGRMGESGMDTESMTRPGGGWLLPGRMYIDDAKELLGLTPPEGSNAATLAGLVLELRGHIPNCGERWQWGGWQWEICGMDGQRVSEIGVRPLSSSSQLMPTS